jgi:hypothetical protein
VADLEKIGRAWSDDELDAIITDYFAMLGNELIKRSYVKSHHSALLMERTGRTHRSVEFKHQNISAVLEEMGLPWIPGYKPKRNYQHAIFAAIDRYLSADSLRLQGLSEPAGPWISEPPLSAAAPFVDMPSRSLERRPHALEILISKFDPAERDARNRSLGTAGEELVLRTEKQQLAKADRGDLARKVRWVAKEDGDGAGFDILSFEPSGRERLIEVKTTNGGARTPFFLSRNEYDTAVARPQSWRLYRVHLFSQTPRIFTMQPPLEATAFLRTEVWRASFA